MIPSYEKLRARFRLRKAKPLFILGTPRSGTTYVARILNSHPRLLVTNESAVLIQLGELVRKSQMGAPAGIIYAKQYGEVWSNVLLETARTLVSDFYGRIAIKESKHRIRYWGEKHPHMKMAFDLLPLLYPTARYVLVSRDPRDSICSMSEMNGWEFPRAADAWGKFCASNEKFLSGRQEKDVFRLRYEDVVEEPVPVISDLFDWLGVKMEPAVTDFLQSFGSVDAHRLRPYLSGARKTIADGDTKDFARSSVRRWQREMDPAIARELTDRFSDFLERHGYEK